MDNQIMDVGVIIPAYNEEEYIGPTLRALKTISCINQILVVDDGSQDHTGEISIKEGARLLKLNRNYGKGYAIQEGLKIISHPIILLIDADLGETAVEAIKLIEPLQQNYADVSIARIMSTPGRGGVGLVRTLSRLGVRFLTGKHITSVLSGQRGFRREVLNPNFFKYERFGIETGMTVDLINQGVRICEVDVQMSHRTTGKDWKGIKHRGRQFRDITIVLLDKYLEKIGIKKGKWA
jgi:glycosyltransferase involved in cell wall biosynthesis